MKSSRWPVLTLILIAANIAAAFAVVIDPPLVDSFGFQSDHPRFVTVLTSLFLHANLLHLLGNMLFLAGVGAAVELATGTARFGIVYFLSGIVGVVAHYFLTRQSLDPTPYVGASGAIAGCAAYYTIRYTSLRVPLAPHVAVPVIAITMGWLALQIAGAFIQIGSSSGVSYWAHLGGFATGLVLSYTFRSPDIGQLRLGHEVLAQLNARGPAAVVVGAERHLAKHPRDTKALGELADAFHKMNEPTKEADTLLRLLDLTEEEEQADVIRRITQLGMASRIPTLRRLQLADAFRESAPFVAKALYRSVAEGPDDIQRPEALFAWASLERLDNLDKSNELLERLHGEYPLHPTLDLARKRGWLP